MHATVTSGNIAFSRFQIFITSGCPLYTNLLYFSLDSAHTLVSQVPLQLCLKSIVAGADYFISIGFYVHDDMLVGVYAEHTVLI